MARFVDIHPQDPQPRLVGQVVDVLRDGGLVAFPTDACYTLGARLSDAGAKQRIEGGFGKLAGYVPGGHVTEHRWDGDTLHFTVEGLGQRVGARLDVSDANVHATFALPAFLAMFSDKIRAKLQKEAPKLLE